MQDTSSHLDDLNDLNGLNDLNERYLVMAGYAGYAGTSSLVQENLTALEKALPGWLLDRAARFAEAWKNDTAALMGNGISLAIRCIGREGEQEKPSLSEMLAGSQGCHDLRLDLSLDRDAVCYEIGIGGVEAALWYFGETFRCGMRVQLRDIPIRQETIEVCEALDADPYRSDGSGWLIGTRDPESVIRAFAEHGIMAACVGTLQAGRTRLLLRGESIGYLNVPRYLPREYWPGSAKEITGSQCRSGRGNALLNVSLRKN